MNPKLLAGDEVHRNNEKLTYSGEAVLDVIRRLDQMQQTVHRIVSYYSVPLDQQDLFDSEEFENELGNAVLEFQFDRELTYAIRTLSNAFDSSLGADGMDDVERACDQNRYWTSPIPRSGASD